MYKIIQDKTGKYWTGKVSSDRIVLQPDPFYFFRLAQCNSVEDILLLENWTGEVFININGKLVDFV